MDLCPEPLWENLCREDPSCTLYQTPTWLGIGARHYQAEIISLRFQFGQSVACLPLLKKRRWGVDRYFSPFGTYAALVCPQTLRPEALHEVASHLRKLNVHLVSSPFTRNAVALGKRIPAKIQVIDLLAVDRANPIAGWEQDQRRRLRIALKNGMTARWAESKEDWDGYFELYRNTLRRWGPSATVAYPRSLFEDIRVTFQNLPGMRLWLAELKGEICSGQLSFYHNRHVGYWHTAATEHYFSLGVSQFLLQKQIEYAVAKGYAIFDMGGSAGIRSLEIFKSKFNAQVMEFESSLQRPFWLNPLAKIRDGMQRLSARSRSA